MDNKLQIVNINGVDCYEKDGTAYLKLEAVARGLGFIQVKNNIEYVRWETVYNYLHEVNFSQLVGKDGFIPENIFYRLAMKAKNETAERFQALVADEIIPTIRKHGMYATPQTVEAILNDPDTMIQVLQALKDEREQRKVLETKIESDTPKVLFAEAVETSQDSCLVGQLAKMIRQNGYEIGSNRLFEYLRNEGYLCKSGTNRNMPTQRSMEAGWFEIKESVIENPDGSIRVVRTPKVTGKGQIYFVNKFLGNTSVRTERQPPSMVRRCGVYCYTTDTLSDRRLKT